MFLGWKYIFRNLAFSTYLFTILSFEYFKQRTTFYRKQRFDRSVILEQVTLPHGGSHYFQLVKKLDCHSLAVELKSRPRHTLGRFYLPLGTFKSRSVECDYTFIEFSSSASIAERSERSEAVHRNEGRDLIKELAEWKSTFEAFRVSSDACCTHQFPARWPSKDWPRGAILVSTSNALSHSCTPLSSRINDPRTVFSTLYVSIAPLFPDERRAHDCRIIT